MADRRSAALAGLVIVAGLLLITALALLTRGGAAEDDLRDRCERVGVGDAVRDAYIELGRTGYRPGCGHATPCEALDLGGEWGSFEWLCDPDDCAQLWRVGEVSCTVDVDPGTWQVNEVVLAETSL